MFSYTRELVKAKITQCFQCEDREKMLSILHLYGKESYERERVQIAILKLSDGDIDKLHVNLEIAKGDYRDVLAYAEYPGEMRINPSGKNNREEINGIRTNDRRQYIE